MQKREIQQTPSNIIFMNKQPAKMTHQPGDSVPPLALESNNTTVFHNSNDITQSRTDEEEEEKNMQANEETEAEEMCSGSDEVKEEGQRVEDENGRERLKKHRIEVAGQVWIPEIWGQEEMLKDWIDCSAFDASLVPSKIMSARAALAEEGRRANSGGLRIENRC